MLSQGLVLISLVSGLGCANASAAAAGIGTGHEALPGSGRLHAEHIFVCRKRFHRVPDVGFFADTGIVMEVVTEVLVAVRHVVDAVEHVGMPNLVNIRRSRYLAVRKRLAKTKEPEVFIGRASNPFRVPVRLIALHEGDSPRKIDNRHCRQRTNFHLTPLPFLIGIESIRIDSKQEMVYCQDMDSQKTKALYDELYAKNPQIFGDSSLNFLKRIFSETDINGKFALDIGGGIGDSSEFLASKGFKVDLVDLSEGVGKMVLSNSICMHKVPIQDFEIKIDYSFVYSALVAHHIDTLIFDKLVKNLKKHSVYPVVHAYRLFTKNSDFYKHSPTAFFDNGSNLDELYSDWKILFDEKHTSKASTSDAVNEVREVLYCLAV